jgi:hypothetical protein
VESGIGTMKMRYANGKAADRIQSRPKKKNPPAPRQQRNDRVNSARRLWSAGAPSPTFDQYENMKMLPAATSDTIAGRKSVL